jgi:hypothetical protein
MEDPTGFFVELTGLIILFFRVSFKFSKELFTVSSLIAEIPDD